MRPSVRLLLLALSAAGLAAAEVQVVERLELAAGSVRRLAWSDGARSVALVAATVPAAGVRLRIADQPADFPREARSVARHLVDARAQVAMVGGYFRRPDPVHDGLCLVDGVEVSPLAEKAVLSAIIGADADGVPALRTRDEGGAGLRWAVQAGPFVVDPGGILGVNPHPAFARRAVLAQADDGALVALASAGPLTLHEVARLLLDHPAELGVARIERAVNCDGGPSAGLALAAPAAAWSVAEQGPVRTVILLVPR
jgi:hypothetical protein